MEKKYEVWGLGLVGSFKSLAAANAQAKRSSKKGFASVILEDRTVSSYSGGVKVWSN